MKLLAIDPSGNFKEGKGTTGFCIMVDGEVKRLLQAKASDYGSPEAYWSSHTDFIDIEQPDHIVMEGYKLYNHKGQSANKQANSELETPQLIGAIKLACWQSGIPLTIQFASDVKTRWSEDVLVRLGILEKKGIKYYWNGQSTVTHHRDALKHALHWTRYKGGKVNENK